VVEPSPEIFLQALYNVDLLELLAR
jgi:hypothetical protein